MNAPEPIVGYRTLSTTEIDLINTIKEQANNLGRAFEALSQVPGVDARWLAIAKTQMQLGTMAMVRAIAKPEGF